MDNDLQKAKKSLPLMLWYDKELSDLSVRILNAAVYYEAKYGKKPNLCLVNPSHLDGLKTDPEDTSSVLYVAGSIEVRGDKYVRPHDLQIGYMEVTE
jgi:hypothetical protein